MKVRSGEMILRQSTTHDCDCELRHLTDQLAEFFVVQHLTDQLASLLCQSANNSLPELIMPTRRAIPRESNPHYQLCALILQAPSCEWTKVRHTSHELDGGKVHRAIQAELVGCFVQLDSVEEVVVLDTQVIKPQLRC